MKTVLVIDDSEHMRITIKGMINDKGFNVIGEAGNGNEGVEKYKELKPDIVTMDVTMSGINGVEALKQIVKHDPGASVIMVSAMGQDIVVKDAIMSGAKGFIVKPFSEQQILETLGKI